MNPPDFRYDVRNATIAIDVRLNDMPVYWDDGRGGSSNGIINDRVIDGINRLTVQVDLPPGHKPPLTQGHMLVVLEEDERTICSLQWQRGVLPIEWPVRFAREFRTETRFGKWSWETGERVELNEGTVAGVSAAVRRLHGAMQAKDAAAVSEMLSIKAREQAVSRGRPVEARLAEQRSSFAGLFQTPGWAVRPIRYEDIRYRLYGDGRVVGISYPDGSRLIRSEPLPDGPSISIPLYLSRLEGVWRVVR